jgi:hypothetical protein
MDIEEWLQYGVERGFCSAVVCSTHDGLPLTEEEDQEFDDGYDACVPAIRIWAQG